MSSDFGAFLLRGIDRQIGLTERLAAAMRDKRHQSYVDHQLRDLLAQRIYQIASGYADGNDANSLRHDPLFKLSVERPPLEPAQALASAPTFSRLEHSVDRKDLYRLTRALVDHFIASYPEPPAAIVLDLDHADDPTHGQQEFAFYNHHYQSYCYLPLFIFEGTSHALVTACLRPGKRPTGAENAMIFVRLLAYLRHHWPQTHILVRGDSHFATPEVLDVLAQRRLTDFVFGLAGNAVLLRQVAPVMQEARCLYQQRTALAQAYGERPPASSRLYEECCYAAASWSQPWRVIVTAEVMAAGDNPRFVVTSLAAPTPQRVYEDLYCARGNCENDIKAVKCDLHSDRTSATTFLANAMRLLLACAAYVLHHALRTHTLAHTALATAQPSTVILTLFKVATQIKQYKDRILLHLVWSKNPNALPHWKLRKPLRLASSCIALCDSPYSSSRQAVKAEVKRGMDWKKLLGSITKSVDEELRLRNAYLMPENRMLRQQSTGRVQLTDSDRQALAEIGMQLGKKALEEIATVAKPDPILAWYRKFTSPPGDISQLPKSVGRPRIDQEIEDVVVRMARENRSWGYDRIVGALANLGYTISDQTVGTILKRHGIPPAPQRKKTVTWWEFIRIHIEVLGATDFFSSAIWAWFAFVISWVLSFILPDRCLKHVASMKSYLHQWWRLVVPLRSLHMRTQRGLWRGVVNEGTRARRELCGQHVLRQPSSESVSYHPQGVLHQGMGRVVFLPVVHPHAIRDGPIPHRQWPGESFPYAKCEAA